MGQSADKGNMMRPLQDDSKDTDSGEEDLELIKLRMKKLRELQKMLLLKELQRQRVKEEEDPEKIVRRELTEKAIEVLEAAKAQFPRETRKLIKIIATLIKQGRIQGPITAEALYNTFHLAGIPVRLETKIRIYRKGKYIDIREKLKEDE